MNKKIKGCLAGIIAAVAYGTNPLGALFLYQEGLNTPSVIFYRFVFAVTLLFIILKFQKVSLKLTHTELKVLSALGFIFASSALSLYSSFNFMDSGIASTILFAYPVMVAVIMALFFKERASVLSIVAIALSIFGIALLYRGEGGVSLSAIGVILVLVSSLTYAVYIVIVNRSRISLPPFKMTFYIMLFAAITVLIYSLLSRNNHIMAISSPTAFMWLIFLAAVPTIIAMTLLNIGISFIGSTPTAIMGALEPVTAVVISICVFDGRLTPRLSLGILLVLLSVILITAGDKLSIPQKKGSQKKQ
ncbi:MAG: EamA family transporter [Bacteroidales bacterium]|nr:EamA family transporter [Bacteroidales bacterium]